MKRTLAGVSVGWLGLSMVSEGVPALLLPHQLLADGVTDAARLGLISLVALGLAALAQPWAGSLSDRVGRWPVIVAGLALALSGLFLLVVRGSVIGGAIIALVGASVAQGGQQPLLPDLVPAAWRGRASGLKGAFDVGGAFVGFAILGLLLGAGDPSLAVGALAAALVASFAIAFVMLGAARSTPKPASATAVVNRQFIVLIAARFLFLLGIYVLGRFLVLFIADGQALGADAAAAQGGAVLAVLTLATAGASVPAGWLADRLGCGPLVAVGTLATAIGIGLVPVSDGPARLVSIGVVVALGSAAFSVATWAMLSDMTAGVGAGRRLGLANWGTAGAAAAAGLGGLLIDAGERLQSGLGFASTFGLAALLAAAGGFIAWRVARAAPSHPVLGPAQVTA